DGRRAVHVAGLQTCALPIEDGPALGTAGRGTWLFNSTIAGIEQADAILLIGANPRLEAAVLNARIRKVWRATGLPIGVIGEAAESGRAACGVWLCRSAQCQR